MHSTLLDVAEACFCGRRGSLLDRLVVYAGDGEWGLACPRCSHLDMLHGLAASVRHELLTLAVERNLQASSKRTTLAALLGDK